MPTRELLSPAQRAQFLSIPAQMSEQMLARYYTLSSDEMCNVLLHVQQTFIFPLDDFKKRFFQRSSTILALAHDALTERQGLPSYFVSFVVRARAVLGLGGHSSHITSASEEERLLCFRHAVDERRTGQ